MFHIFIICHHVIPQVQLGVKSKVFICVKAKDLSPISEASWGLALDASSGKVSGQVNEPQQVECTVTAKEGEGEPATGGGLLWWTWPWDGWMGVMGVMGVMVWDSLEWAGNLLVLLCRNSMFLKLDFNLNSSFCYKPC